MILTQQDHLPTPEIHRTTILRQRLEEVNVSNFQVSFQGEGLRKGQGFGLVLVQVVY